MSRLQQVVLQCPREYFFLPYRQSPGPRETQGSTAPSEQFSRRHGTRMLQLWDQERLSSWFHPSQIRHCGCSSLPPAVRRYAILQGHELGRFSLATVDRR